MMPQNKARTDIIIATFILFAFMAVLAFMYAISDETPKTWLSVATEVALFPVTFLSIQLGATNLYLILFFTLVNILLYALLFIRLFSKKISDHTRYKPFALSYYAGCAIPSFIIVWVVYGIITSK